jgi:uncharacterized repeat protein (TIGR03803 family)
VFKITPSGKLTTLYSFCGQANCPDSAGPDGTLIQAADGDFYGPTLGGGNNSYGTVFKITASGKLTTLYSFAGYPTDGSGPSTLVQAANGNFYGADLQLWNAWLRNRIRTHSNGHTDDAAQLRPH